jgi:hypothetical protein
LKIAVSTILVFGLLASAPAFAKSAHAPAHTPSSGTPPATAANAGGAKPAEPIDADVTILAPRGGFTPANRNANVSLKIAKPENFTRRPDITAPIKPIVRNAIGQPVPSRSVIGAPHQPPSPQAPGLVPKAITRSVVPAAPPLPPPVVGRTAVHPTTTVGIPSSGRIDGARLIRPSAAPLGVGGPAHPVGGINGTAVRTTR